MYTLTNTDVILRDNGEIIPCDRENPDYLKYLEWVDEGNEPQPAEVIGLLPNWQGFTDALRGSALWAKVFQASTLSLIANAGFTLLYGTLTTTHNLADLESAIGILRGVMGQIDGVGDFTAKEIKELNKLLNQNNFALRLN